MKEKRCTGKCKQVKPLDDFGNDKATKDGKARYCKKCKCDAEKVNRDNKKEAKMLLQKSIIPKGKILCERNNTIISKTACIVDCNDVCWTCKSRQEGNMRAGGDVLTAEEEAVMRHEGVLSMNYTEMIEPYAEV
jgi:hypothetical protein